MSNRRSNFWSAENMAARQAKLDARVPAVLTSEQLAAQKQAQRDARVNSVVRSGLSQRNHV